MWGRGGVARGCWAVCVRGFGALVPARAVTRAAAPRRPGAPGRREPRGPAQRIPPLAAAGGGREGSSAGGFKNTEPLIGL